MLLVLIPYFLTIGTGTALAVFYYMCNFDLYSSCKPDNAVLFLVLSIIIPVCQPFFYLACRKKDLGMVVPQPEMPAYTELPKVDPEF